MMTWQIYNMLSSSAEIRSLSPVRKDSFTTDLPGVVGKYETKLYLTLSFMMNCIGTMVFGGKVKSRCSLVDPSKVATAKARA